MARRRVIITLPEDAYRRLAELAEAEERVVDQQASLLLKRLLRGTDLAVGATYEQQSSADDHDASRVSERRHECDGTTGTPVQDGGEGGRPS